MAYSLIISPQTVNSENYTLPVSNQLLKFELGGHLLKLDVVERFIGWRDSISKKKKKQRRFLQIPNPCI